MEKFEVRFDNDIFFSGQTVNGRVIVILDNAIPIRGKIANFVILL